MTDFKVDAAVIGGGAAGMSAARALADKGYSTLIVERENQLGGILLQCIHNGFGVHEFKEELTGPEYAERWEEMVVGLDSSIPQVFLDTTVMELHYEGEGAGYTLVCVSPAKGFFHILADSVILTSGCRERNRGNIRIPGTRPAGVYTAGLAQRMVNMEGLLPGKNAVIVGSGDIGLIMARRLMWSGCKVHAVVEIQPYPSGLTRNIVQCLNDFKIPLYLSHVISKIHGKHRIEAVDITPLENGRENPDKTFTIECDTLLLSVGLVPSSELAQEAGAEINPVTGGPVVDGHLMTTVPGLFAAGNVLHVHDLVDFVSAEARRAGDGAARFLAQRRGDGLAPSAAASTGAGAVTGANTAGAARPVAAGSGEVTGAGSGAPPPPATAAMTDNGASLEVRVRPGSNVRYVVPGSIDVYQPIPVMFRPMIVKNSAKLSIYLDGQLIREQKKAHVQPSEMVEIDTSKLDLGKMKLSKDSVLEVVLL